MRATLEAYLQADNEKPFGEVKTMESTERINP